MHYPWTTIVLSRPTDLLILSNINFSIISSIDPPTEPVTYEQKEHWSRDGCYGE